MGNDRKITRRQAVDAVLGLFDEIEALRTRNDLLNNLVEAMRVNKEGERESGISDMDAKLIEYGRKALTYDTLMSYHYVYRIAGDGDLYETFDKWCSDNLKKIPDDMSRDDFMSVCGDMLYEIYLKDLEKAKQKAGDADE